MLKKGNVKMLRLKNIRINEHLAEADFFPEDTNVFGYIAVDLQSEEIKEIVNAEGYEYIYPGHARNQLVKMAREKDMSTECVVYWY